MGLYAKIEKQMDKYYEVVSINKSISRENFYLKRLVSKILIFIIFMKIKCFV